MKCLIRSPEKSTNYRCETFVTYRQQDRSKNSWKSQRLIIANNELINACPKGSESDCSNCRIYKQVIMIHKPNEEADTPQLLFQESKHNQQVCHLVRKLLVKSPVAYLCQHTNRF